MYKNSTSAIIEVIRNIEHSKVLTKEEVAELYEEMNINAEEARNILIESNLKLVLHIIHKQFSHTGYEIEELFSIGCVGLIKGINTFDITRGVVLATYISKCIINEILIFLRDNKKHREYVSVSKCIATDEEGKPLYLDDVLESKDSDFAEEICDKLGNEDAIEDILYFIENEFPPRISQILKMQYGLVDGIRKNQKEISQILGLSQSYISRIERSALCKMKKYDVIKSMQ